MTRQSFLNEFARSIVAFIGLGILLVSCAGRGDFYSVPPTLPPAPPTPEITPASVSIVATVMDTSLSARIIILKEPVDGFSVIALTEDTKLSSEDGSPVELKDFQHGVQIRAIGKPGSSGTLLAEQIILLSRK